MHSSVQSEILSFFFPLYNKWKMSNMHMHLGFLLIPTVFHFLLEIMIYEMISIILPEVVKKIKN